MISGVWFADENIINFGALSISHIQMYSMLSGLCCFERIWGLGLSVFLSILGWGGFEHIRRCCWQILLLRNSRWPRPSSITTHSPSTYKLLIPLFLVKSLLHILHLILCELVSKYCILYFVRWCQNIVSYTLWAGVTKLVRHPSHWSLLLLTSAKPLTLSYYEPSAESVLQTLSYDEPSTAVQTLSVEDETSVKIELLSS